MLQDAIDIIAHPLSQHLDRRSRRNLRLAFRGAREALPLRTLDVERCRVVVFLPDLESEWLRTIRLPTKLKHLTVVVAEPRHRPGPQLPVGEGVVMDALLQMIRAACGGVTPERVSILFLVPNLRWDSTCVARGLPTTRDLDLDFTNVQTLRTDSDVVWCFESEDVRLPLRSLSVRFPVASGWTQNDKPTVQFAFVSEWEQLRGLTELEELSLLDVPRICNTFLVQDAHPSLKRLEVRCAHDHELDAAVDLARRLAPKTHLVIDGALGLSSVQAARLPAVPYLGVKVDDGDDHMGAYEDVERFPVINLETLLTQDRKGLYVACTSDSCCNVDFLEKALPSPGPAFQRAPELREFGISTWLFSDTIQGLLGNMSAETDLVVDARAYWETRLPLPADPRLKRWTYNVSGCPEGLPTVR